MYLNEILWFAMLVVNFGCITLFYQRFGKLGLYIWVPIATIVANLQVIKLVTLFGVESTLGNIVYASSFLVTDILSENHSRKDAQRAVVIGFMSLIAATALMQFALAFQASENDFSQKSLLDIFGFMPRLTIASLCAYLLSQFNDVWLFHFLKSKSQEGKGLWLRNNLSTMISQAIDSIVFTLIAFWGVLETSLLVEIIITTYLFKFIVAALDTPFVYFARYLHKNGKVSHISMD